MSVRMVRRNQVEEEDLVEWRGTPRERRRWLRMMRLPEDQGPAPQRDM